MNLLLGARVIFLLSGLVERRKLRAAVLKQVLEGALVEVSVVVLAAGRGVARNSALSPIVSDVDTK